MRAVDGNKADSSGALGALGALLRSFELETDTMPGLRALSSWKWTRAATRSFVNSRGPCVPAKIGAVKRGHSTEHACLKAGSVREADLMRESCTAPQKRNQSSAVSSAVDVGSVEGGIVERIRTNSGLE